MTTRNIITTALFALVLLTLGIGFTFMSVQDFEDGHYLAGAVAAVIAVLDFVVATEDVNTLVTRNRSQP